MRVLPTLVCANALLLLLACGGGDTFQDQGPTEAGEAPLLSFEPIAGTWAGWGLEASGIQFWIRTTLSSSARRGQVVGTIEYGMGDTESEPDCRGDWIANNADHPVYVVAEEIGSGNCPNGRVVLTLDAETEERATFSHPTAARPIWRPRGP